MQLTAVDENLGLVELALRLDDVECADCVLPPGQLLDVVDGALRRAVPGLRGVRLDDPRALTPAAKMAITSETDLRHRSRQRRPGT